MRFLVFGCVLSLLILGCSGSKIDTTNNEFSEVYDVLIQSFNNKDLKLKKYITKDGKSDTVYVDTVNWQKELKPFFDAEISKSTYDDYEIKSFEEGCKKEFHTKSNKHHVKMYKYNRCNGQLNVEILVEKSSPLYEFDYKLQLNSEGYIIETVSDVEMAYESKLKIEGKFYQ